ncbi:MAG: glycoside hydrolase [Oscillospiraceae bacterium]|jgi:alpha-glucosidase|nr:glycoside hydrolase [Oscillospiraceae bacterium]
MSNYFRFQKVDDYFSEANDVYSLLDLKSHKVSGNSVLLTVTATDGNDYLFEVQPVYDFIVRFRFNPVVEGAYSSGNTRAIITDTVKDLKKLTGANDIKIDVKDDADKITITYAYSGNSNIQVIVHKHDFSLDIYKTYKDISSAVMTGSQFNFSKNDYNDYNIIQSTDKPYTAKYVGFGEQGGLELIKNNSRITYFNYDNMKYNQVYGNGCLEEREPLYHSDPFFIQTNADFDNPNVYGILVDNPSEVLMDIGAFDSSKFRFGTRYGDMDYYVIIGRNPADIIRNISKIIGTARLIPRYALGYHQGCYGYEKRSDLEETAVNYRKNAIPLDGLHVDVDLQDAYKTFTINEEAFPNPAEMFATLRGDGIKCSTNITPIISNEKADNYQTYLEGIKNGYFVADTRIEPDDPDAKIYHYYSSGTEVALRFEDKENNYNSGKAFIGEVYYGPDANGNDLGTTGHYPDLNRSEVRKWWGRQYQYLFDCGLEMVWQDMTTPCLRNTRGDMLSFPARLLIANDFHKCGDKAPAPFIKLWNLYSYNLHKATYHGLNHLKGRENKRNFIVGRGCFTGMQRFAALWTGDNASTWDFLKINVSQVLALGLTGQALSGQDIGGFESSRDDEHWCDPELLIRWTAMGAFLPWFRNHYIKKGKKYFQEPYMFQTVAEQVDPSVKVFYDMTLPICRYYIELRYTLLQLFYDAMYENALTGMPVCRALFLENSDPALFNDKAAFINNEFLVRRDLLVAPVTEPHYLNANGRRDIYLPGGCNWYQFKNGISPLDRPVKGGTTIFDYDASISYDNGHIPYVLPIFVREGAIIPTVKLEQYVGELNEKGLPNPITLNIYPGQSGEYTMYLDDGVSRSSADESMADPLAKGEYREVHITHQYGGPGSTHKTRNVTIEYLHNHYAPKFEKYFIVAFLRTGDEAPINAIFVDDTQLDFAKTYEKLENSEVNTAYHDFDTNIVYVKVFDCAEKYEITAKY